MTQVVAFDQEFNVPYKQARKYERGLITLEYSLNDRWVNTNALAKVCRVSVGEVSILTKLLIVAGLIEKRVRWNGITTVTEWRRKQ